MTEQDRELKDQDAVERAERLARLVKGDPVPKVWHQDLLPMLEELHFTAMQKLLGGEATAAGACKALQDFVAMVGGNIQLGQGALRRIAARRIGKEAVE